MSHLIDSQWTSVSALTGIAIGETLSIQNAGRAGDIIELILSVEQPSIEDRGYAVRNLDPLYRVSGQDVELWVRYVRYDLTGTITPEPQRRCLINITENEQISEMSNLPVTVYNDGRISVKDIDKPDYLKLEDDPFPTPLASEAGVILEITDLGDRYRWTSTEWVLIELRGIPVPIDYFIEASSRNIPGVIDVTQAARSLNVRDTEFQTLWDHEGNKKYLTANTQLYASSSSASDVGNQIRIEGLNSDYELGITTVVLNGQNQVAIPGGEFFRVREAFVDNALGLTGDVYISEIGTTTGGVPDDPTLVQTKIPLEARDSGEFASTNMSHNGFFTVPDGFDVHLLSFVPSTAKGDDIRLDIRKREEGEPWVSLFNSWAYSGPGPVTVSNKSRIQQRSDIELRVLSGNPNGQFSAQVQFLLKERQE